MTAARNDNHRWRLEIDGTVQGVGFRPFVYQLARQCHLAGWIRNTGDGVLIEVEGCTARLRQFAEAIPACAPTLARVNALRRSELSPRGDREFRILPSEERTSARADIPPDVATCPECLRDIADPSNRRYRYPFTNCTNCGPRFTIIRAVPYDRERTTMCDFPMCPDCRSEYDDPADRRFHAQPTACPVCGPHLRLEGFSGRDDAAMIEETVRLLRVGDIVAIKGLGGYHLACDAWNAAAVHRLRERKGRAGKPFALMCRDLPAARLLCDISPEEERLLDSPERPIVLLTARRADGLLPAVAPGMSTLGIMLPYSPLHHLLMDAFGGPLVMTSGNLSEEPIAFRDDEVRERLGAVTDAFLAHNRPIHIPCDDSVVRLCAGSAYPIRRSRGQVPVPIELSVEMELPPILACGGDLKNTFCLARGREALLSQHLGDLENAATLDAYRQAVEHFCTFYRLQPQIIVHDLHPDYHSTRFAHTRAGVEHIGVQHHHAHIAACMAENQLEGPVIGVAFDGTGYGCDGTIWGGEFLIAGFADARRAAHLAEIGLAGGEVAIRHPGRGALAWLRRAGLSTEEAQRCIPGISPLEAAVAARQLERGVNCPRTTSMGRLFDAVAALLGICGEVTYEGQAAIELEMSVCEPAAALPACGIERDASGTWVIDPLPLIQGIVDDRDRGVAIGELAAAFHAAVTRVTVETCLRLRDEHHLHQVALSGGVFQNLVLLEAVLSELRAAGFEVFWHRQVPCNDGGLSLGQAMVAAGRYHRQCV